MYAQIDVCICMYKDAHVYVYRYLCNADKLLPIDSTQVLHSRNLCVCACVCAKFVCLNYSIVKQLFDVFTHTHMNLLKHRYRDISTKNHTNTYIYICPSIYIGKCLVAHHM